MNSDEEDDVEADVFPPFVLPPEVKFERTSIDDLIDLACVLLNAEQIGASLRRVGVHGDFTEEEEAAIDRAIADHAAAKGWGPRDDLLLPLSVALARWVAEGRLPSVDGAQARAFLEDRYFGRTVNLDGLLTKQPSVEEVIWVAREVMNDPLYWDGLVRAGNGSVDRNTVRRGYEFYTKAQLKYGLVNRSIIGKAIGVLRAIVLGKIPDIAGPEAEAYVESDIELSRRILSNR